MSNDHMEKFIALIQEAKANPQISRILREGTFSEKMDLFNEHGISNLDIENILEDLSMFIPLDRFYVWLV